MTVSCQLCVHACLFVCSLLTKLVDRRNYVSKSTVKTFISRSTITFRSCSSICNATELCTNRPAFSLFDRGAQCAYIAFKRRAAAVAAVAAVSTATSSFFALLLTLKARSRNVHLYESSELFSFCTRVD